MKYQACFLGLCKVADAFFGGIFAVGTEALDLSQGYITQTKAAKLTSLHAKSRDQSWRPL